MTDNANPSAETGESRRCFIKAAAGLITGTTLFGAGVFTRLYEFFFGPKLTPKEQAALLAERLQRMQSSVALAQLELQREVNDYTFIAALGDLSNTTGKYFIDFRMRPALAFLDDRGLPNLLSAKCTHLGCTVGNQVDDKGQILCPCHISYFDIKTGQPNAGAPAKRPLPHLAWVLMDKKKNVIARCDSQGKVSGAIAPDALKDVDVYVARDAEDTQA